MIALARRSVVGVSVWTACHPLATLIGFSVCLAAGVWGAMRIQPTASLQAMLSEDSASSVALARVADGFAVADDLIVVATLPEEATPRDGLPAGTSSGRVDPRLGAFVDRLLREIEDSADLRGMCAETIGETRAQAEAFFTSHVVPAALIYADQTTLSAVRDRLTPKEMGEQITAGGRAMRRLKKLIIP